MGIGNIDNRTSPATSAARITSFNDATVITLPNGKIPRGFVPDADGTLSVYMADDVALTNAVPIVVKGGLFYPISVRVFRSTGSITVTAVTALG